MHPHMLPGRPLKLGDRLTLDSDAPHPSRDRVYPRHNCRDMSHAMKI